MVLDEPIGIIGTGDFARAFAKRLLEYDYKVIIASRAPEKRNLGAIDEVLGAARVTSFTQCIQQCPVIIVALHHNNHSSLRSFAPILEGKILIDVSNPSSLKNKDGDASLAEKLQKLLPNSHVVKAFNTVSAYSLESSISGESRVVHVCGDDVESKKAVQQLARTLGFSTLDFGSLKKARQVEKIPLQLFKGWGVPTLIATLVWIGWMIFSYLRYYVLRDPPSAYTWERLWCNVTNKVFGCTSLTLLALTYLPGCIAAFTQISNGTKHKRFPGWLDAWMKMRKQLGLHALSNGVWHLVLSAILINPAYYGSWHKSTSVVVPLNRTMDTVVSIDSRLNWKGEVCILLGALAVFTMVLQGITSLPSVGALLNWREWTFSQSYIGFLSLFLAMSHTTVKGVPDWIDVPLSDLVQKLTFTSSVLPWIVVLMRIILWLPGISGYLWKIRRGWERGVNYDIESGSGSPKLDKKELETIQNGHTPNGSAGGSQVDVGVENTAYL